MHSDPHSISGVGFTFKLINLRRIFIGIKYTQKCARLHPSLKRTSHIKTRCHSLPYSTALSRFKRGGNIYFPSQTAHEQMAITYLLSFDCPPAESDSVPSVTQQQKD